MRNDSIASYAVRKSVRDIQPVVRQKIVEIDSLQNSLISLRISAPLLLWLEKYDRWCLVPIWSVSASFPGMLFAGLTSLHGVQKAFF
jgi:hypothetical protein